MNATAAGTPKVGAKPQDEGAGAFRGQVSDFAWTFSSLFLGVLGVLAFKLFNFRKARAAWKCRHQVAEKQGQANVIDHSSDRG